MVIVYFVPRKKKSQIQNFILKDITYIMELIFMYKVKIEDFTRILQKQLSFFFRWK